MTYDLTPALIVLGALLVLLGVVLVARGIQLGRKQRLSLARLAEEDHRRSLDAEDARA